jgi:hypothetical protein
VNGVIPIIATLALMIFALAVLIGKVEPGAAVLRLGIFIVLLCIAPAIAGLLKLAVAVIWKPLLILLALVAVVTVLVRVLLTMVIG